MKKLIPILLGIGLSACGLSDTINQNVQSARQAYATLSLLVKDVRSLQYPEVWIQLHKVELMDSSGQTVEVYSNPTGKVFNLASKSDVAELLNAKRIPTGRYTRLRVTLGSRVVLIDPLGKRTEKTLASSDTLSVSIPADIQALENQLSTLALSFDLDSLLNAAANVSVISDIKTQIKRAYADLRGTVVAINADNSLDIRLGGEGPQFRVTLHPGAIITDEQARQILRTLSGVRVGDVIDIFGNLDLTALRIEAVSLVVNGAEIKSGTEQQVISQVVKAEGIVQNVTANSMDIDITEASFVPPANIVGVIDVANALYGRGDQALLRQGAMVEVKGTWDGSQIIASYIEVEGAPTANEVTQDEILAELKGTVTDYANNLLSVSISESEGFSPSGNTLVLNLADVWFKQGNPGCLIAGSQVKIKGISSQADSSRFDPTVIEIDDCATFVDDRRDNNGADNDGDNKDKSVDSGPAPAVSSDDSHAEDRDEHAAADNGEAEHDDQIAGNRNDDGYDDSQYASRQEEYRDDPREDRSRHGDADADRDPAADNASTENDDNDTVIDSNGMQHDDNGDDNDHSQEDERTDD